MIKRVISSFVPVATLVLLAVAPAQAQVGKVTGTVTDIQTGEPLVGAQVYLEGIGRGALTAENGRYFIVNVQPDIYTVVAELIGYQTVRIENVAVSIDQTRNVNFELTPQAIAVEEIRVEIEATPLIETSSTGTRDFISLEDITSLPITSINEALALRNGFLEVPQNTDVVAFTEEQRGINPVRIRGGRNGETLTLIDGVPINNFVFGGPAFQLTPYATQQIDFIRGGFDPQYGNALSGIINIATREASTELEGALEYRTSELAGALGSEADDLADEHLFQGFVSGPVPGTNDKLRFVVAGREDRGVSRVVEFDDVAFDPKFLTPELGFNQPLNVDLWQGWRGLGFDNQRDIFGKATLHVTPAAKLSGWVIDYRRETQPFFFHMLLAEGDPITQCIELYADEELCNKAYGTNTNTDIARASAHQERRVYSVRWDHTVGRTFYEVGVSRFDQSRETCNFFQGICLEDRFANKNFTENFASGGISPDFPASGTEEFFGGEDLESWNLRGDVQSQLSDHHNVGAGIFFQTHDLRFDETRDRGISDVLAVPQVYEAEPWELGFYLQDRIEYDFMTISLGFRVDLGEAGGLFFADPRVPTNGTTALDVCENPGDWQNRQVRFFDDEKGEAVVDTRSADPDWTRQFCTENRDALEEAALIASSDDFVESKRRSQFSPRIGVTFPVTANSNVFFNFGRFSQNPLFNNLFVGTGIGTNAEGTPEAVELISASRGVPFVGNPNLVIEETTSYEVGYLAELFDDYAMQIILFNKDQNGLTGVRTGGLDARGNQIFDEGVTYGTNTPSYPVVVNQDFTTVRGIEVGIRKRLTNYWGFDLNYSLSSATTNAAPPERQLERLVEGDPESFQEITSEIDQTHVFNGAVRFRVGEDAPLEGFLGDVLRHSTLSFIARAASGLPYTPTPPDEAALGFTPDRRELNSGRAPATFQLDLLGQKEFQLANVRYGLFLQVVNLTDNENCIQVSPATGRCDPGAFDFLRRRRGNPVGLGISSTSLDRANWVGQRRKIMMGVRVSF